MQISEDTLSILKNFTTINTSLTFKKGNVLRTINTGRNVVAEATIDTEIPLEFSIYELNQLISVMSLHKSAPIVDIEDGGKNVIIRGARSKITYRCCDSEMVKNPPEKSITLPSEDMSFLLTQEDYAWIMKSSAVLNSPNIFVAGKDGKLVLGAYDLNDDASHTDSIEVGDYTGDPAIAVFKSENWKMMAGTYKVSISTKGIALFEHSTLKLKYWVALESKKS